VIAEHAFPWVFLIIAMTPVLVFVGIGLLALMVLRWGTSDRQQARLTRPEAKSATGHGFEVKLNTSDQSPVPGKEEKGIE
jgi:hypothetical protein